VISPATPLIETVDLGTLDDVRAVVADDALPEPTDPAVRLRALPARTVAVIRYSGNRSQERYGVAPREIPGRADQGRSALARISNQPQLLRRWSTGGRFSGIGRRPACPPHCGGTRPKKTFGLVPSDCLFGKAGGNLFARSTSVFVPGVTDGAAHRGRMLPLEMPESRCRADSVGRSRSRMRYPHVAMSFASRGTPGRHWHRSAPGWRQPPIPGY
jgi:hypothetical protein